MILPPYQRQGYGRFLIDFSRFIVSYYVIFTIVLHNLYVLFIYFVTVVAINSVLHGRIIVIFSCIVYICIYIHAGTHTQSPYFVTIFRVNLGYPIDLCILLGEAKLCISLIPSLDSVIFG